MYLIDPLTVKTLVLAVKPTEMRVKPTSLPVNLLGLRLKHLIIRNNKKIPSGFETGTVRIF
jgi:hypothetical protein